MRILFCLISLTFYHIALADENDVGESLTPVIEPISNDITTRLEKIENQFANGVISKAQCVSKKSKLLNLKITSKTICDNVKIVNKKEQNLNDTLCKVRAVFEQYNLISGLHTFFAQNDANYENILPPLRILNENEKNNLLNQLYLLNFKNN